MFLIILQNKIKENPECQYNSFVRFRFEFGLTFRETEFHSTFVLGSKKIPKCPFGLNKLKSEYKNSTLINMDIWKIVYSACCRTTTDLIMEI